MTPGRPIAAEELGARGVMLRAEARYARERYQLYRAKSYGSRFTSLRRLQELERAWRLAEKRLEQASEPAGRPCRRRSPGPADDRGSAPHRR